MLCITPGKHWILLKDTPKMARGCQDAGGKVPSKGKNFIKPAALMQI